MIWLTRMAPDQLLEAVAFGVKDSPAEGGEPVIAAARVVQFGRGAFVGFLNEFRFDEPLERPVERRRP